MHYVPTGRNVLVTIVKEAQSDVIIVPEGSKEPPIRGKALAVGADVKEIKAGDKLIFGRYSGTDITLDKVSYRVMGESEVLLIEASASRAPAGVGPLGPDGTGRP